MSEPKKKGFSRRKFLVRSAIGAGVMVGTTFLTRSCWRRSIAEIANTAEAPYPGPTDDPKIWFEILADNQVILHSPKVEMGQGTFTSLAQMAADELEIDLDRVKVVHAVTDSGNVDGFSTGGSTSVASLWVPLRELAATMREMLKLAAVGILGADAGAMSVKNGLISANGKSITYGEIVQQVTEWEVPDAPTLKDIKEYKYIGKPVPRVDLLDKVI
ncbi:MAG: molybdopterin cofactor-binding domain-containing protein, partial [Bacteroidota bacterium]